jgi:hypothetical protein
VAKSKLQAPDKDQEDDIGHDTISIISSIWK